MRTSLLILVAGLYLAAFVGVAYLTRAKMRRLAGALSGGAAFGVVALLAVALGEIQRWWQVPKAGSSHFQLLLWLGIAASCTPVYLITWRVARRFGGRGLAVLAVAVAVVGPLRDYRIAAMFPDWIAFSPGLAPVLAVATIYALLVIVGHAVMRIVSGPSQGDSFARLGHGMNSAAAKLP
jgi:hypothetical protein